MPDAVSRTLEAVLTESAGLGFLGPGPVPDAISHAAGFAAALRPASRILDLGSGGGLPGLVLAELVDADLVLLDGSVTRTDFLRRAVGRLGLDGRVRVVTGRAELVVRTDAWRGGLDAVVSRGFGPPPTTAECAAPFLRVGGQLVVSEPPHGPERWPAGGVARVGLAPDEIAVRGFASFTQQTPCPTRFPRRSLRPPLF
jgi:16S rRNA (guanine527-N7)-methyltransferase